MGQASARLGFILALTVHLTDAIDRGDLDALDVAAAAIAALVDTIKGSSKTS